MIHRQENTISGSFGVLSFDGVEICKTLELPWRNNISNFSCIPTGVYTCSWTWSPRFKRMMYEVKAVKGRSGIRIHRGSFAGARDKGLRADFSGCIGLGKGTAIVGKQKILTHTSATVAKFEQLLAGQDFTLIICGEFEPL